MRGPLFVFVLGALFVGALSAQYAFSIKYSLYDPTLLKNGLVKGTLYYRYDTALATNMRVHYVHTVYGAGGAATTIEELENYQPDPNSGAVKTFKICGSTCESSKLNKLAEPWFYKSGDSMPTSSDTYKKCTRSTSSSSVHITEMLLPNTNAPTSAANVAKQIKFSDGHYLVLDTSSYTGVSFTHAKFLDNQGVQCYTTKCRTYMDLVFVFDESGSIWSDDFKKIKTFARAVVGNLTLGEDATKVSLVLFGSNGASRTWFSLSSTGVDANIASVTQKGGNTYQGQGLQRAINEFNNDPRRQKNPKPACVVIALTDGEDHNVNDMKAKANTLKSASMGCILMEVGAGYWLSTSTIKTLREVSSKLNGQDAYFGVENYNDLLKIIDNIITPICNTEYSSIGDCEDTCQGFCGCGKSCYCPSCDTSGDNACISTSCTVSGKTTYGCQVKNKTSSCIGTDKCYSYGCDSKNGCTKSAVDCRSEYVKVTCQEPSCSSAVGCQDPRKVDSKCPAKPCSVAKCSPKAAGADITTGCVYEYVWKNYANSTENGGCILYDCGTNDEVVMYDTCCTDQKDKDKCYRYPWNETKKACNMEPIYDPPPPCQDVVCDPKTGDYKYVDRQCPQERTCQKNVCDVTVNKCVYVDKTVDEACDTSNKCKDVKCNKDYDRCEYVDIDPPGDDPCIVYTCDPETGNWSFPLKCDDGLMCTIDECDRDGNCTHRKNECEELDMTEYGTCFVPSCSEARKHGCYRKVIQNSYFDECGNCIGSVDDLSSLNKKEASNCKKGLSWPEKVGAMAAGIVAAIVIACIIGAVAVAAGTTYMTRELIRRARAAADTGAVENPMYEDSGREMTNPAFEGEDGM